jgi:glycosyltransferase involved in cell wall biosynthesis
MTIQVSVVVPTRNRPQLLERCLDALLAQTYDPEAFEIIVVDDAACAATEAQVAARAAGLPSVRYLPAPDTNGPAAARNRGWAAAQGEIIAFTDDDCVPAPGWLRAGTAAFVNGTVGVMGRTRVPLPLRPTDNEWNQKLLEQGNFVTANCFYRRQALAAVGGFDERFKLAWREDSDLLFRLQEVFNGSHHFARVPEALVNHPPRPASWGISLQQQHKSMFNALLYKKHPTRYRAILQQSPPWHYYRISAAFLAGLVGLLTRRMRLAAAGFALWSLLSGRFARRRLCHTSRAPAHVAEMFVTSHFIPLMSVFWRLVGALKFHVFFL